MRWEGGCGGGGGTLSEREVDVGGLWVGAEGIIITITTITLGSRFEKVSYLFFSSQGVGSP